MEDYRLFVRYDLYIFINEIGKELEATLNINKLIMIGKKSKKK